MPKTNKIISENISSHAWLILSQLLGPSDAPCYSRISQHSYHVTPGGPAFTTTIYLSHSLTCNTISSPLLFHVMSLIGYGHHVNELLPLG